MRPYRTIVIRQRVIARFARGYGSYPPPAVKIRTKQGLCQRLAAIRVGNACEQRVPGIRGPHPARAFLSVKGESIKVEVLAPERFFEFFSQLCCLVFQRRTHPLIPQRAAQAGGGKLRRVNITLNFAEGYRGFGQRAVRVENRVI